MTIVRGWRLIYCRDGSVIWRRGQDKAAVGRVVRQRGAAMLWRAEAGAWSGSVPTVEAALARLAALVPPPADPGEAVPPVSPEYRRGLEVALALCSARPTAHAFSVAAEIRALVDHALAQEGAPLTE